MSDREKELERLLLYGTQKAERLDRAISDYRQAREAFIDPYNATDNATLGRRLTSAVNAMEGARTICQYATQEAREFLESSNIGQAA